MDRRIIIGLVAGLILGVIESFLLGVSAFSWEILVMTLLMGGIIGFASTKITDKVMFYLASVSIGAILFVVVALRSGLYLDDIITGGINGLLIGFLALTIEKKLNEREQIV